jgi:hypothetical protein
MIIAEKHGCILLFVSTVVASIIVFVLLYVFLFVLRLGYVPARNLGGYALS